MKKTEIDETCSTHGGLRKAYKILVGEPKEKRSVGRNMHK